MKYIFALSTYVTKIMFATVVISLYSCDSEKNQSVDNEKPKVEVAKPPNVEAFILTKSDLTSSIKIPGELIANQQVDLYAKVNSYIKKLLVDVGSEVKAGQLLAELEAPEISSQLSAAKSRLNSQEAIYFASKATYDRLYETNKTPGTISKNDLDQANAKQLSDFAQLDAAKSIYQEILTTIGYLKIKAPFSGVITNRSMSIGAYVGPSGKGSDLPLFTLKDHSNLKLVVSIPEAYTAYINTESEVEFYLNSIAGEKFHAKVARLAGSLDTKLRSQHIEMDVINNNKLLIPGMVAEVTIPLTVNANAYSVPSSAILNASIGVYVISVHNNLNLWVPIKMGRTYDGKTEIFGAIQTGDTILTRASEEIRDGVVAKGFVIK
jgi:RND family efflux transporter MFP subunit